MERIYTLVVGGKQKKLVDILSNIRCNDVPSPYPSTLESNIISSRRTQTQGKTVTHLHRQRFHPDHVPHLVQGIRNTVTRLTCSSYSTRRSFEDVVAVVPVDE
jgi:hypothetical protein